ncbi:hypothetical protein BDN70DRAFT_44221 [Pholiota conissans]|uniref:RNA-dependent RNA polymerase n=1 Tax=Pholiota conissans TaxID=109636 RepID=A0A9P5YZC3_9AGAR|nr:hypothetical protein BDN70DRAFT_44221 [Pholiota conissans]
MDKMQISLGVRYELARLITIGKVAYRDITADRLKQLQGPNAQAGPKIAQVFAKNSSSDSIRAEIDMAFAREIAANSPWSELDRETNALSRDPHEGVGNNPKEPGWYGGKIHFGGRIKSLSKDKSVSAKKSSYEIVLDSCSLSTSSRFTRRFGSWSFVRIKIPQDTFHSANNNLNEFFKKPFVIWGQVYRACYAKRDNVFLFLTNELYPLGPTIPGRFSLSDFVNWHNPIEHNAKQLMTKWSARFALGFSNSVPGPQILPGNLIEEADVVSEKDSDMTDGCGWSTKSIHRAILDQLSLSSIPAGVQFRVAGCKGMILFADDERSTKDDVHRIWPHTSQIKIRYPQELLRDPAMLTIDVLRTSRMTTPSKISAEIIINLAENGVPHKVFVDLLKETIQEIVDGLTNWEGPDAMTKLWTNVERAGGVLSARRAREAVGEARARGYSNKSPEDIELEDNDEDGEDSVDVAPRSVAWWADEISGCPSSLFDTAMSLVDSGFIPQQCPVLRQKLRMITANKVEARTQNIRFEVLQSCIAFAVPDPYGVLGPEEIQIKSSRRNLMGNDGLLTDVILGDVLIARNPCKVPSDIRKVRGVEHPALRNYTDAIVFSVQGLRRLIDFLAGGDYDGDTVLAIWMKAIVEFFKNADEKYSMDPKGLEFAFTRDTETGATFLEKVSEMNPVTKMQEMQTYLLGALLDPSLIGQYSMMHNNAIYQYGYGHPRTHKIAAKFVRVMDASKTGYRIKPATLAADMRTYHHGQPQWIAASKKDKKKKFAQAKIDKSNVAFLKRDQTSAHVHGKFIMDRLHIAAEVERERLFTEIEKIFAPLNIEPDPDLIAPWKAAVAWAEDDSLGVEIKKRKKLELSLIAQHVQGLYKKQKEIFRKRPSRDQDKNGPGFTDLPIEVRQDELRSLSRAFASEGPQIGDDLKIVPDKATLSRWQASYAYLYDAEQNCKNGEQSWSRFPWNVAFRELCSIKASTLGPYQVVTTGFYERFKLVAPR